LCNPISSIVSPSIHGLRLAHRGWRVLVRTPSKSILVCSISRSSSHLVTRNSCLFPLQFDCLGIPVAICKKSISSQHPRPISCACDSVCSGSNHRSSIALLHHVLRFKCTGRHFMHAWNPRRDAVSSCSACIDDGCKFCIATLQCVDTTDSSCPEEILQSLDCPGKAKAMRACFGAIASGHAKHWMRFAAACTTFLTYFDPIPRNERLNLLQSVLFRQQPFHMALFLP